MEIAAIDLETIPNQRIPEACKPGLDSPFIAFGNTKDEIKKQAILEEKLPKKMSTTPSLAQICTFVGIRYDTESEEILKKVSIQVTKQFDADDIDAVNEGWDFLKMAHNAKIPIVSFNGIGFDLPVMWHRAIAQDIPIDQRMYSRLTPRFGSMYHYDLLGILAGWTLDKMKGHTLDFFLSLYGIGSKGEMDGSQVYDTWNLGEYNKVQEYCESDVLQTCKLFQRVERWIKIEREEL